MSTRSGDNATSRGPLRSLHLCGPCASGLVYPRPTEERGEESWWLG